MGEVKVYRMTCIVCPVGCEMEAQAWSETGEVIFLTGNRCPKGKEYAEREIRSPRRVVMSVLEVEGGELPTVSVKTDRPVPKELISRVMEEISHLRLKAPVEVGQVVVRDVAGSGADLVATRRDRKAA